MIKKNIEFFYEKILPYVNLGESKFQNYERLSSLFLNLSDEVQLKFLSELYTLLQILEENNGINRAMSFINGHKDEYFIMEVAGAGAFLNKKAKAFYNLYLLLYGGKYLPSVTKEEIITVIEKMVSVGFDVSDVQNLSSENVCFNEARNTYFNSLGSDEKIPVLLKQKA